MNSYFEKTAWDLGIQGIKCSFIHINTNSGCFLWKFAYSVITITKLNHYRIFAE